MKTTINKFVYWTPRVLAILFLCFLFLFSLDVIEPGRTFGEIAIGMLMHNIPVIILLIILIISWKHEIVGGIAFGLAAILYMAISSNRGLPLLPSIGYSMIISGPALLISILFLIGREQKQKNIYSKFRKFFLV